MTDKKTVKKADHTTAIVAGIASLTAAAVGAYYLYGHKDSVKNRVQVKSWMLKAKGEVLEKLEDVQNVSETSYMSAVDAIAHKYKALKMIDPGELVTFIGEMRNHWTGIKKTVKTASKKPKTKAKSKKTAKK